MSTLTIALLAKFGSLTHEYGTWATCTRFLQPNHSNQPLGHTWLISSLRSHLLSPYVFYLVFSHRNIFSESFTFYWELIKELVHRSNMGSGNTITALDSWSMKTTIYCWNLLQKICNEEPLLSFPKNYQSLIWSKPVVHMIGGRSKLQCCKEQ